MSGATTQSSPLIFSSINSSIAGISWPPTLAGMPAAALSLLQHLEKTQWLPRDFIVELQHRQLATLAAYAERQSPFFRQRLRESGLQPQHLASPEAFRRLPVMTRHDVQQAGDGLYCQSSPRSHGPTQEIKTSGSTGQPVAIRKNAVTGLFWQANTLREHFWHRRDFRQRLAMIRSIGTPQRVDQPHWGIPVAPAFASGPLRAIPITFDIGRQVAELLDFRPAHLLVYPGNLAAIIDWCERQKVRIPGIRHVWCHAESLKPKLRARAAAFFGASIEDNYSSEEAGIMALQCPQSGLLHVMAESVILEVLDDAGRPCAEGQSGRVVVTDLHNFSTPLIRYAIGDHAEVGPPCPCGRGLPTLKAVHGRERNLVLKPDGSRHWPRIDMDEFPGIGQIRQYQLVQRSLQEIEVRLVTDAPPSKAWEDSLTAYLQTTLEYPFAMRFSYFEGRIPPGPGGKFEEFLSLVKPPDAPA